MKHIKYKDVLAMSGSHLHKLLSEGKAKEAETQHKDINQRYKDVMERYPSVNPKPNTTEG